ncbi:MAG: SLC13 family permease [Bilophila wadsworthia]
MRSFSTAFATFSTSGWWIMVGAFALGAVAGKTGLLKRISLCVLHLFPASFAGQVWGLIASGTVISPLIPSINAKATLSTPIALSISDELDMERKKAGACGLFGACYVGFVLAGHMFMSGSFTRTCCGAPRNTAASWLDWLLWSLWGLVMLSAWACTSFGPTSRAERPLTKDNVAEQIRNLGPLSREERITLWTLIITLLLWMTEAWHGISSGEVAVTAMCVLLMSKVMDRKDFKNGIDWPSVVYVGSILNLAAVIRALHVDRWLGVALKPYLLSVVGSPASLIVAIILGMCVIRLLIVSISSAAAIFVLILPPLLIPLGMNPWIVCMVAFAGGDIWYLKYMNAFYLCADLGTEGKMANHRSMIKLSAAYMVICTLGFIVSIPFWRMFGLLQ